MSNIIKFKDSGLLDPFFRDFLDADGFLGRVFGGNLPAANISETDKSFAIDLAVPGFKKEDFKVRVEGDVLTISAETSTETNEEQKSYKRREYNFSRFSRSFRLPDNVDDGAISATYDNGILKLALPKAEAAVTVTKEIKVL